MPASLSPMMQQYRDAKQAAGDALLLFRMGDFYELFFDDAKIAARTLGIALTSRDKGDDPVPMAGFPYHQLDTYLAKIIAAGHRAAICEQVEDPKQAKGLVKREVTRIVTPGTLTDDALLDPQASNFLAAIAQPTGSKTDDDCSAGIAWVDVSTGRFHAAAFPAEQVADQLARIQPSELLISDDAQPLPAALDERRIDHSSPAWAFGRTTAIETLTKHFGTHSLEGFGFDDEADAANSAALRAAGAVLNYLAETQKASLAHINQLLPYSTNERLAIDPATRRSLELVATIRDGSREGSLLGVLDRTVTSPRRTAAGRLARGAAHRCRRNQRPPRCRRRTGHQRDASPASFAKRFEQIYDIQRLLVSRDHRPGIAARPGIRRPNAGLLAESQSKAHRPHGRCFCEISKQRLDLCADIRGPLEQALVDECPLTARDGNFIRDGYRADIDELRELLAGGKQWMAEYQAAECQRTGIASMKVGFNSVFGYYLEVTHAHREKVPADYIRKQTLKNAERYITPAAQRVRRKSPRRRGQAEAARARPVRRAARDGCRRRPATASHGRCAGRSRCACRARRTGPLAQLRAADGRRRAGARYRSRPPPGARHHRAGRDVCAERFALRCAGLADGDLGLANERRSFLSFEPPVPTPRLRLCSSPAPTWPARARTSVRPRC